VRLSLGEPVEGLASVSTGPHIPMTTSAGHFLSMQPSTDAKIDPLTMWYRADEYMAAIDRYLLVVNERDKYRAACEKVMALWNAPDDHLPADGDLENVPMDILVAAVTIVEGVLK
jgi:hypothetical protein